MYQNRRFDEIRLNSEGVVYHGKMEMVIDTYGHSWNDRFCTFHLFSLEDLLRKKMKEYCRPEQWVGQLEGIMLSAAWLQADRKRISMIIYKGGIDEDGRDQIKGESIRTQNKGSEEERFDSGDPEKGEKFRLLWYGERLLRPMELLFQRGLFALGAIVDQWKSATELFKMG